MKVKQSRIVNMDTGEIYNDKVKEVNYFNEQGYLLFTSRNYSRLFSDIRIPDDFTDSELGKIYRLQAHIQKGTNLMIKRTNKGYRAMTLEELVSVTNLSERLGKDFIKKLIDYSLLARITIETGGMIEIQYYFNPLYFHNAKRLSVGLYNLFKNQIDPYLNEWVKNEFKENTPQRLCKDNFKITK